MVRGTDTSRGQCPKVGGLDSCLRRWHHELPSTFEGLSRGRGGGGGSERQSADSLSKPSTSGGSPHLCLPHHTLLQLTPRQPEPLGFGTYTSLALGTPFHLPPIPTCPFNPISYVSCPRPLLLAPGPCLGQIPPLDSHCVWCSAVLVTGLWSRCCD